MGILDFLFGNSTKVEAQSAPAARAAVPVKPTLEPLGNLEAICPNCSVALPKMPGRKTQCKACGKFMYVRTRPSDKIRVVVSETDAQRIDEQWMVVNGTWEAHLAEMARFEDERGRLAKKFGRAPSDRDVQWGIFNRDLIEQAKLTDWGLYRNTRLAMGDLLKKEGQSRNALMTYLEVSYIDANGPNNLSGLKDIGKPFTPSASWASQAPAVVGYIEDIARELQMNESALEVLYLEVTAQPHSNLRMPLAPERGWKRLIKEIGNLGD